MREDVVLLLREDKDGPIHISRATRRSVAQAILKLQAGNPRQLTPDAILLASEPEFLALTATHAGQLIRGAWYRPPITVPEDLQHEDRLERELRAAAHMRTVGVIRR